MLVQQELINGFYAALEKSLEDSPDENVLIERKDRIFLRSRPLSDNLNIDYWINSIAKRMELMPCIFTEESPFISYFANRVWLRLAYDIAKIISTEYSEYRVNWLKILYPDLIFKKVSRRQIHLDPIFFTSSFDRGIAKVYLVNTLPRFVSVSDIKKHIPFSEEVMASNAKDYFLNKSGVLSLSHKFTYRGALNKSVSRVNTPDKKVAGSGRILHEYYLKFHESYFYVLSQRKLYYVFADGYVEDVCIINVSLFHDKLVTLLETQTISKPNPLEITQDELIGSSKLKIVAKNELEELIVNCGGYPNLDLRSYYINDDRNKLFSVSSFFFPRGIQVEGASTRTMFRLSYVKYRVNPADFDNFRDILPHVIFDDYKEKQPRPLTFTEFVGLRYKLDNKPYTTGRKNFTLPRRFITEVFDRKWVNANISIPRNLLVNLIPLLLKFYNIRRFEDFVDCKKHLNDWSRKSLQNNFQEIFSVYKQDFKELLDDNQYLSLLRRCEQKENNTFWFSDSIREIYKLYSTSTNIRLKNNYEYHIFNLFMSIMISNNYKFIIVDVLAILEFCLKECPDQLSLLADFDFYDEVKRFIVDNNKLIEEFKLILIDSSLANKTDIEFIIEYLTFAETDTEISYRCKRKIVTVFARHDEEVKFSENDHNKALTPKNRSWIKLAKLLTGMGYFDDYLQLLCPSLTVYTDKVTGRPFSDFDLRDLIFSHDRKYLINISHSRNLYKILGWGFDCNSPKIRYLGYEEVKQIKEASPKYSSYYNELSKQHLDKPSFNFRIIIGLQRLVTATTFNKKSDRNHYSFIIVDQLSDVLDTISQGLFRYFYKNVTGEKYITVYSSDEGIICYIDYNDPQKTNTSCTIYNHELSNKPPIKLTALNFEPYRMELIYILRKKSILPLEYDEANEKKIDSEYAIFAGIYRSLNSVERNLLNSIIISYKDKAVYFKDIYSLARYDLITANLYFINMLQNIYPRVTFNSHIRYKYYLISNPFRSIRPQYISFKDPTNEIDKIFVSFMTHSYVIEGSIPSEYLHHTYSDTPFIYPKHQVLYWLSNSFTQYYVNIHDPAKHSDEKVEYLYDMFTRFFYYNIDDFNLKAWSGTYVHEVNNWITKIVNGEVFRFIHIFELDEILEMVCLIKDSEEYFLHHTAKNISNFIDEIRMLYMRPSTFNRAIANIKLIKLFSLLNRYDIKLKSDLDTSKSIPHSIYLDKDRSYIIHYGNDEIKKGRIPEYTVQLAYLDTKLNEIELRKRIWSLVAKQGDISLFENDFVIIFSIIYRHKTLKRHAKNLLKSFLVSQEIEEADEEKFKKAIISLFNLDEDFILGRYDYDTGLFKDLNINENFERIAEEILKLARHDTFKANSVRPMSPSAVGWEF